jgi:RecJ-like exonuclease
MNAKECPQCLGAKEIMLPKETRGFEYKECSLCHGEGKVPNQIFDDYIFSLDEDNFDDDFEVNNGW